MTSSGMHLAGSQKAIPLQLWMLLPWLLLAITASVSLLLFFVVRASVEDVAELRFGRLASDTRYVIQARIDSYGEILYGLAALFTSQETVSRLQFHRYVKALDLPNRFPGFDVVNYAAYVRGQDKQQFEESVRRDTSLDPRGYPNFAIKPPGDRPEYFVLVYVEPLAGFEFAFGLDTGVNPAVKDSHALAAAVNVTRDSGKLNSPGLPIRVKRQGREYIGLAMRLGVYRNGMPLETVEQRRAAFLGSVGAGFNVENVMKGVLDAETSRSLRFRVFGARSAIESSGAGVEDKRFLLFDSQKHAGKPEHNSGENSGKFFMTALPMEVAGREWEIHFSAPKEAILDGAEAILPQLVLGAGLLSGFLLFGMMHSLASARGRAVHLANEITKDLSESEAGLAEAQQMAHLGNWMLDPATWRMTGSDETQRILGLESPGEDFAYADFLGRVHEDDHGMVDLALRQSIQTGRDRDIEHRIRDDSGVVRWVQTVLHPARRDARGRVPGTIMDITQRKLAEDELKASAEQLQALSRRLVDAQEVERRRFSRELHDLVGQNLTALSINLDILKSQLGEGASDSLRLRLDDSATLLESTTAAIENVMSELRPPMLDDYGLLSALQWYGNDFTRRTGIDVKIQGDEATKRLPPGSEIALFRIAQEALNNIAKHAQARCVEIGLENVDAHIVMSIADDGVGFDAGTGSRARRRPGLGMVTMRERTQAIGGTFEIETGAGAGTRITVKVPA